jgi:hypothetical protein
MKKTLLVLVIISFVFLCGCDNSEKPVPPEQSRAKTEMEFQGTEDSAEYRAQARQAAVDFLKGKLPKWSVKGTVLHLYWYNTYRVYLDIQQDKERRTLELFVTRFYPDNGEAYWKADTISQSIKDALHDEEDFKNLKERAYDVCRMLRIG